MFATFATGMRLIVTRPKRAWLLTRMTGWVVVLSGLVRILPLPRALSLLSTKVRDQTRVMRAPNELATAIDAVLGIDVLMVKPNCWKRAAVLHRYLALNGIATTIMFGVRKEEDGELKGHAWLQSEGRPYLESEPPLYNVTYSFPSAQSFEGELALMAELK